MPIRKKTLTQNRFQVIILVIIIIAIVAAVAAINNGRFTLLPQANELESKSYVRNVVSSDELQSSCINSLIYIYTLKDIEGTENLCIKEIEKLECADELKANPIPANYRRDCRKETKEEGGFTKTYITCSFENKCKPVKEYKDIFELNAELRAIANELCGCPVPLTPVQQIDNPIKPAPIRLS